jgi:hypothetical protein
MSDESGSMTISKQFDLKLCVLRDKDVPSVINSSNTSKKLEKRNEKNCKKKNTWHMPTAKAVGLALLC